MAAKPKLYYFRGRGRKEFVLWLLAAAGVEFEDEFFETREQYEKLQKDGHLHFGQVHLVKIDGMVLMQTRAILGYLAAKCDLSGKDLKERVGINMYTDGNLDLMMMMIAVAPFEPPNKKEESFVLVVKKAKTHYLPIFEKILKDHREDFLIGNKFSWADVQLLEAILMGEELDASVLSDFPLLKVFKHISNIPTIKKFLQPGSPKKPPRDSHYLNFEESNLTIKYP
uniref:Glutathione S-transferase n=1 Tax=Otolemur garnettii TaxID=30611 RepID=H0XPU3_OTOGA